MPIPKHLSHFIPKGLDRGRDGYAVREFIMFTDPGFPPELLLEPDLWMHVTHKFRPFHDSNTYEITVIARDGSFEAFLRLMQIDPLGNWAAMRLLREWPLGIISEKIGHADVAPPAPATYPDKDGYTVEFSGPQRWRITRSGVVVAKDMPDEATAVATLDRIRAAKPATKAAA